MSTNPPSNSSSGITTITNIASTDASTTILNNNNTASKWSDKNRSLHHCHVQISYVILIKCSLKLSLGCFEVRKKINTLKTKHEHCYVYRVYFGFTTDDFMASLLILFYQTTEFSLYVYVLNILVCFGYIVLCHVLKLVFP